MKIAMQGKGYADGIVALHPCQVHSEPFLAVAPALLQGEATLVQDGFDHGVGVLVAVFGVNAFACLEGQIEVKRRQKGGLIGQALQIDFHSRNAAVPQRNMAEGIQVEIGIQFAVQTGKNILVEGSGDALRVVVGRHQDLGTLGEIGAQQQSIARAQCPADTAQKLPMLEPM